jgi:putative transposase
VKYRFIEAHRDEFAVSRMCTALGVSRAGYYASIRRSQSRRERESHRLTAAIRAVHEQSREAYGALKTWRGLQERGESCGRHRVARLRRKAGLIARRLRRFRAAYAARNAMPAAPNLLSRQFRANAPNQIWVADITFIPTRRGWLYLAIVVDLYARRVVGWSMSRRIDRTLVGDALSIEGKR